MQLNISRNTQHKSPKNFPPPHLMATQAGTRHVRPGNSLEIMIGVHLASTPTTQSVFTYTTTICMQSHRTTVCRQGFTAVVRAADSESRGVSNSAWPIPHYPLPPPPTIQYIFPSIYMYSGHWTTQDQECRPPHGGTHRSREVQPEEVA